jgi:calmodulin
MSRKINEFDNENEIREAINVIFKERDSVGVMEVWYIMRKYGDKLSDEEVNDLIQQAKTGADGKIKYDGMC